MINGVYPSAAGRKPLMAIGGILLLGLAGVVWLVVG
jgi:hypothetical protein